MKKVLLIGAGLLVCFASIKTGSAHPGQSTKTLRVSEGSMRKLAIERVMPAFPLKSRKQLVKGVGVGQVEVGEKGEVERVTVLEAPDSAISKAVDQALNKWRFKPSTLQGEPVRVIGKLTFYFSVDRGKANV